jgi:hypothetical protein
MEAGTYDDAVVDEVLYALVNGGTTYAAHVCYLLEGQACVARNHFENLFV